MSFGVIRYLNKSICLAHEKNNQIHPLKELKKYLFCKLIHVFSLFILINLITHSNKTHSLSLATCI